MTHAVVFRRNFSYSRKIFRIKKRVIRNIMRCRRTDSWWNLLKKLKILSLKSQYIFYLLSFVVNNEDQFIVDIRQSTNLHLPQINLAVYQKEGYYLHIKIFNHLPPDIKNSLITPKKLKQPYKFWHINSFYSWDEYFNINKKT